MPMNRADYHPDWESISRQIREQADWKCEFCGLPHLQHGARDKYGDWHSRDEVDDMTMERGRELFAVFPKWSRIVLTVAHLNHDRKDNDPANLRALCQKCHLSWDAKHHAKNAAETRRRKRMDVGQQALEAA